MTSLNWQSIKCFEVFNTAEKNMLFDESLLNGLSSKTLIQRVYLWPSPGVTLSYKQTIPKIFHGIDSSKRITGGGIVLHNPNDIVFSIIGWNDDPRYPKETKKKLSMVSEKIRSFVSMTDISLTKDSHPNMADLTFCSTYPTPFEISSENQKILGLTIRKFRTKWLVQGIIHTSPTHPSLIKPGIPFFSLTLDYQILMKQCQKSLFYL